MHDVAHFESVNIPSVGIFSSAFKPQATFQAAALGIPGAMRVFVPHPISDQSLAQLLVKGKDVYQAVVDTLTSNDVQMEAALVAEASSSGLAAQAGGECAT